MWAEIREAGKRRTKTRPWRGRFHGGKSYNQGAPQGAAGPFSETNQNDNYSHFNLAVSVRLGFPSVKPARGLPPNCRENPNAPQRASGCYKIRSKVVIKMLHQCNKNGEFKACDVARSPSSARCHAVAPRVVLPVIGGPAAAAAAPYFPAVNPGHHPPSYSARWRNTPCRCRTDNHALSTN